jgi:hypothetical protein
MCSGIVICVIIAISIKSYSISKHKPLSMLMNPLCRYNCNVADSYTIFVHDTVSFFSSRVAAVQQPENLAAAASPMPRYARSIATHPSPQRLLRHSPATHEAPAARPSACPRTWARPVHARPCPPSPLPGPLVIPLPCIGLQPPQG